jgi:hypothetical protein
MARVFDRGSSEYLEAGSTPVAGVPLTMACWFWTSDTTNDKDLMCVGSSTAQSNFIMRLRWDDYIYAATYAGGSGDSAHTSTTFTGSAWQHACVVFRDTDDRSAYLNGGGRGNNATDLTPADLDRIDIGCYIYAGAHGWYWPGSIAEAAIWNVALTDDEVAVLATGVSPLLVRPQSLVFYAPFIRDDDEDLVGGLSLTANGGPTVGVHPRVIYPGIPIMTMAIATAAAGVAPQMMHYARLRGG